MNKLLCLVVLQVLWLPCAGAATYKERYTMGESYTLEQHHWTEYNAEGEKLRQENGQRVAFALIEDNIDWNHPGIIYETKIEGMMGVVFYNDNLPKSTVSNAPYLKSKADYFGGSAEAMIGQRYGYLTGKHMLEILGGIELESWLRNIRNGNGNTGFGRGVREAYGFVNAKLALGVANWFGDMRQRFQVGVRYPVFSRIAFISSRKLVTPGSRHSFYGFFELSNIAIVRKRHMNVRFYMDSYQLAASSITDNAYQDRSQLMNFGVSLIFHN